MPAATILSSCICFLAGTHAIHAQWVNAPSKEQRRDVPGLIHETYDSSAMATTVGYSVVLPPGYSSGTQRYPVVYWLHGGGGNESSNLFTAAAWRELSQSEVIREVILVYPCGHRSGYMDHHDNRVRAETMIIGELIPLIDQQFRTINTRAGRAVHGFSMGSSGALKFATKYPDKFCCAVAWGGGAINLETTTNQFVLDVLQRNLNSDPDLIRRNNTYHYLQVNQAAVREHNVRFLLICGNDDPWKPSAVTFHAALNAHKIPCDLTLIANTGHNLRTTFARQGRSAAIFQEMVFRQTLSE